MPAATSQQPQAAPLRRTHEDLERVASYGVPGVTMELLEGMAHEGKRIVLIDEQKTGVQNVGTNSN